MPAVITEPILVTPFGRIADFDVSDTGTLVYVPAATNATAYSPTWSRITPAEMAAMAPPSMCEAKIQPYTMPTLCRPKRSAASATVGGHRVYVGMMRAPDMLNDCAALLNYAFDNYDWSPPQRLSD